MKIKDGYLLKNVASNFVVVPVGDLNFDGLISLNESGALLWERLEKGAEAEDLILALTEEYGIESDLARRDVEAFLDSLRTAELIDE
ncbi:MAG: PqqD family protein [Clostridia bacterium]|nr:PqqD family protein [Clostridia bacterium]